MARFPELRSYLDHLESAGRLRRVRAPVDKDWELACIARWAIESTPAECAYAILFEEIKDRDVPVVVNLYPTPEVYAGALGTSVESVLEYWAKALARTRKPKILNKAPVQEVVKLGGEIHLDEIPAPVWTPGRDAGPYLSAASVITKDPETGIQNMGNYRIQIHDDRQIGLFFGSKLQHGAIHYAKYTARGEAMPVAVVVGAAPAVEFAAAAKTAYGVDELEIASALLGEDLDVVRGNTVDLLVPAKAECVIEGYVSPGTERMEGPFGEALGYMNLSAPAPFIDVRAICHREAPIHRGYVQQLPPSEGHIVMEMGMLGPFWYYLTRRLRLGGIRDLGIVRGSAGLAILVVQVGRSAATEVAAIGRVLTKFNFGQKFIVLVDADIDVRDPETVFWALSSRVDPETDIQFVSGISAFQTDPSVLARYQRSGKVPISPPFESSMAIVDATLKGEVPEISLPGRSLMMRVLESWERTGLPPIHSPERLSRLLRMHSEDGLHFDGIVSEAIGPDSGLES